MAVLGEAGGHRWVLSVDAASVAGRGHDRDGREPCTAPCTSLGAVAGRRVREDTGPVDVLIERESELAALDEIVRAAASGRGGAALIEGEAGIGKTRLMGLTRARAEAEGLRVLYATADEI